MCNGRKRAAATRRAGTWMVWAGLLSFAVVWPRIAAFGQDAAPAGAPLVLVATNEVPDRPAPAADAGPDGSANASYSAFNRIKATGKTGFVQLSISVLALAFALERLVNLRRRRVVPEALVATARRLWKERRFEELAEICRKSNSTLGRVIQGLIAYRERPVSDLSVYASDEAGREVREHLQRIYPLAVAATVEPLLGLFGTAQG